MSHNTEFADKKEIALEIKKGINTLNELIEKAHNNGLTVEIRDNSTVMASNIPPLQVAVFERKEF